MNKENLDCFPLSKERTIKGSRKLAREKAMQVIIAQDVSGADWEKIFDHVFFRIFTFDTDKKKPTRLLTPDEIFELEADLPINWDSKEIEYGRSIIINAIDLKEFVDKMLVEFVENWELNRITLIDKILIRIAVTEFLRFQEIPIKVSINEAIEIGKKYSTYKSGIFINGMLDKFLEKLRSQNLIVKTGRGLVEI